MNGPSCNAARWAKRVTASAFPSRVARSSFWSGRGQQLLRGAHVGGNRIQTGHDRFFLRGALLPFAQSKRRGLGGWLDQRHAFAIGLGHQDAAQRRWRGAIGAVIGGPLAQQIRVAARRQAQFGIQRAAAANSRGIEIVALKGQLAEDRVVAEEIRKPAGVIRRG